MNLPNKITTFRMVLVVILVAILLLPFDYGMVGNSSLSWKYLIAFIIFIVASISDYFDGHIARKYNLITTYGKFMDPIADKLLVNSSFIIMATQNPIVTFTMENGDVMKAELYPEIAPTSVNNFVNLVQKGFYDGLIFHRVIAGFMIQGGDPEGTGMGGPGYSIKGEFASNGFKNDLKHTRGVLSMARSMRPDSAGSQFFIMHQNAPHLDGDYAAFGKLIEGEDVLDKIAGVDTDYSDRPRKPQVMKTVTVETFGEEYPEPDKL